jgi:hypothetical protein
LVNSLGVRGKSGRREGVDKDGGARLLSPERRQEGFPAESKLGLREKENR